MGAPPALPQPAALTEAEAARVADLVASVLAAPDPKDAMLAALAQLVDREQLPALAARLFETVVWRADLRHYWIYFRMARAYAALGPSRDDATFMMAALAAQMQPDWGGTNQMFGDLFAVLRRRGEVQGAAEVFLAAADLMPERPPAEPFDAAPVFAAAGMALPGSGCPPPRPDSRKTHRVIEAEPRPAWTPRVAGGAMPYALRQLATQMPRLPIDIMELANAEVLLCDDTTVVIDRDGTVHPDLSVSRYPELVRRKLDCLMGSARPPEIIEVAEAVVISDRFPPPNLCHFLLDQITRLALYQRAGVDTGTAAIIGPHPEAAFQTRILQRAGVDPARVIGSRRIARVRAARLWVSSNCCNLQHAADLGAPWAVQYAQHVLGGQGTRGWRRLYVSRGDVAGRRVTNEADVMALLEPLGFEVIQPGTMLYDAQVAAFRQASHIIAPHGAALTHMILCPPGAEICEIFHPLYGTAAFAMQAQTAGVNYTAMLGRDFQFETPDWNDADRGAASRGQFLSRNLRVDLAVLRSYLDTVTQRGGRTG